MCPHVNLVELLPRMTLAFYHMSTGRGDTPDSQISLQVVNHSPSRSTLTPFALSAPLLNHDAECLALTEASMFRSHTHDCVLQLSSNAGALTTFWFEDSSSHTRSWNTKGIPQTLQLWSTEACANRRAPPPIPAEGHASRKRVIPPSGNQWSNVVPPGGGTSPFGGTTTTGGGSNCSGYGYGLEPGRAL